MRIPKIIHQTWKTAEIPRKWKSLQRKNIELHKDFEYKLWTDVEIDNWVKIEYPELYASFSSYRFQITRVDVIRYLLMYKIGGIYLDLDYELLVPFHSNSLLVLPKNRSKSFGDEKDEIGNCFFASVAGHTFWEDVITELTLHPPTISSEYENHAAAGPGFLTRMYFSRSYQDVETPERIVYHPPSPKTKSEYRSIINNGLSLGIHHGWGSWKDRLSWKYLKQKYFN